MRITGAAEVGAVVGEEADTVDGAVDGVVGVEVIAVATLTGTTHTTRIGLTRTITDTVGAILTTMAIHRIRQLSIS